MRFVIAVGCLVLFAAPAGAQTSTTVCTPGGGSIYCRSQSPSGSSQPIDPGALLRSGQSVVPPYRLDPRPIGREPPEDVGPDGDPQGALTDADRALVSVIVSMIGDGDCRGAVELAFQRGNPTLARQANQRCPR